MMNYKIIDNSPIKLSHCEVTVEELLNALNNTNGNLESMYRRTKKMHLDVFSVIDFRVLSGLVGEVFASELASVNTNLVKNPYLDGYPDLLQIATPEMKRYFESCGDAGLNRYKHGGLEVKNTFGSQKSKAFLLKGDQRIKAINKKLDWKAHHQETNDLIALFADYFDGRPKIAALFYSNTLCPDDWGKKQNPKEGSGMTSFSGIKNTGFKKLKSGLKICLDEQQYLDFIDRGQLCQTK